MRIIYVLLFVLYGHQAMAVGNRCDVNQTGNLNTVFFETREALRVKRCRSNFNSYFVHLLRVAEGYPGEENKRTFSEFLVWASEQGYVSRKDAEELYNRYFSPKFISMMGDYNVCSSLCKRPTAFQADLVQELGDKELGLLKISEDSQSFGDASRLYDDSLTVVQAACRACEKYW